MSLLPSACRLLQLFTEEGPEHADPASGPVEPQLMNFI